MSEPFKYQKAYTVDELRRMVRPFNEETEFDIPGPYPVIVIDDDHNAREFTEGELLGLCMRLWVSENQEPADE